VILRIAALAIAVLAFAPRAESQSGSATAPSTPSSVDGARLPFGVGERLEYDVKYGFIHVGNASMELAAIDSVRGRPAWHAVFIVRGGIRFCSVNDRLESWLDATNMSALRFKQDINECGYDRRRNYEFLPELRKVIEGAVDTAATVDRPLDEASFLYFIRTIALPPGLDTGFYNYFIPDRNPIRIRVLRRERIKVPAGEFDAIVLQPIIKAKGLFSEGGQAQVWLSDDSRHIMLQLKTKVPGFSLNLYLKSYRPPNSAPHGN
jgi:hypothetical protein